MKTYTLITGSRGKLAEIRNLMGMDIDRLDIDLPEIQEVQVEEVVRAKLYEAYRQAQRPVMVEDTGLYVRAWNDFPGALIKWLIQTAGIGGLCRMLDGFDDRTAYARTIVGVYDGAGEPRFFAGTVEGRIAPEPRGDGGFGWDKIFIPAGAERTFGEMDLAEKNRYSMRRKAIGKLTVYLRG